MTVIVTGTPAYTLGSRFENVAVGFPLFSASTPALIVVHLVAIVVLAISQCMLNVFGVLSPAETLSSVVRVTEMSNTPVLAVGGGVICAHDPKVRVTSLTSHV